MSRTETNINSKLPMRVLNTEGRSVGDYFPVLPPVVAKPSEIYDSSVTCLPFYFGIYKRVADIVLGGVLLVLVLPLVFVCMILIKLSSDGSVMYKQVRVGKDSKLFDMYKLRTMYIDAESSTGPVWASDNDPRVVPICRWMRRSHVDELPQLINVIMGQMSLVGPRPERPEIMVELRKIYPNVNRRLVVRPGITGLAQIRNGYDRTIESFRRKLNADLEYIENWTLFTELWILAATLTKIYDKSSC